MRSSRISGTIKKEVCVITQTEAFNNSSNSTRTEFNNCFMIHLYLQTSPLKKPFVFFRIWHKQDKLV